MPFTPYAIFGAVISFMYGIVVGSFLNVCIYRLPAGESLVAPPSHCPSCQHRLHTIDLFPLFSFLTLKGKCRYCGTRISWRYFTIELITGLLFIACWLSLFMRYPNLILHSDGWLLVVLLWIFAAAMLVTFMIDLDTTFVIVPVTWVALAAGVIFEIQQHRACFEKYSFTIGGVHVPSAIPGMVLGFLVFVAMDWFGRLIFRKPGMGLGDAYIGAAIGAMLGPGRAMLSFGMATVLCAVIGVILIIAGRLAKAPAPGAQDSVSDGALKEADDDLPQGHYVPFGPFLTACAVAVALAPEWFSKGAVHLWYWWMHQNPFMS